MSCQLSDIIAFTSPTSIHFYANGSWLVAKIPSKENDKYTECEINNTAVKLLSEIHNGISVQKLIKDFCNHQSISVLNNSQWIIDFVNNLLNLRILTILQNNESIDKNTNSVTIFDNHDAIFPSHASIELTDRCNLSCGFCYLSAGPNNKCQLDYNTIIRVFDELKENGVVSVDLTGGELFLHPDANKIITKACEYFVTVGVLTNGTILTEDILNVLAQHKRQIFVNISLDSTDPAIHNKIRHGKNAFEKTTKNIKKLTAQGIKVRIASVIFKDNMWEIHKLAQLSVDLGATAFAFNFVEGFGRGQDFSDNKGKVEISEEYLSYINKVLEKYKKYIPVIFNEQIDTSRKNCGAGTSGISISSNGELRPCPLFPRTSAFGNILTQNLEEILQSSIYKRLLSIPAPSIQHGCNSKCPLLHECQLCFLRGLHNNLHKDKYCSWVTTNHLEDLVQLTSNQPVSHGFRKVCHESK